MKRHPFPKATQHRTKLAGGDFTEGKRKRVRDVWLSQLWDTAEETHFSPAARKVLRWDIHDYSKGQTGKETREEYQKALKDMVLSDCAQPAGNLPMSFWEHFTLGFPP